MSPCRLLLACLLLALCAQASAQGIYRWTDDQGRTVFSDRPPPTAESAERVRVFAGRPDQVPAYRIRMVAQGFPVVLYTSSDCAAPCDMARELLLARDIPFTERMIATEDDVRAFRELFDGVDIVPAATVGPRKLMGFEPAAWNGLLDRAGYP